MADRATFLITGASRGLGRGLVEALLWRPNTTVIAATRGPEGLQVAPESIAATSRLVPIVIDSESETSSLKATSQLRELHNIDRIDVVIANAGTTKTPQPALETSVRDIEDCLRVNTFAPLLLYQAMWPLLEKSPAPKFIVISSIAGSIGEITRYASPSSTYGVSKAAINFLVRRIGRENSRLIALAIHPGWVKTDMGNAAAVRAGRAEAVVEVKDAVYGILEEIENATRETAETFRTFDHQDLPW